MAFDREKMIKDLIRDGVTAVYAYTEHFTDANLRTMKSLIEDETRRRAEHEKEAEAEQEIKS